MNALFLQKTRTAVASALMVIFLGGTLAIPVPARAQPVAVVIASAVAVAIVAVVVCDFNLFNVCPPKNSGGKGTGGSSPTVTTPKTNPATGKGGKGPSGTGTSGTGTGSGGICFSAPNAACGIKNQGTIVGGVCNATVPLNSSCPAPIIASGTGFYADPTFVRSGSASNLHWTATNATICAVTGGGLNLSNLGITGSTVTGAVNAKTVYTLTCLNGAGGPATSANTTINLDPSVKEI